jgi:hypothetical protein
VKLVFTEKCRNSHYTSRDSRIGRGGAEVNPWLHWVGLSFFMGGAAICAMSVESYANERRDPMRDRLGTSTVFHEAWMVGWVSIDAGVFMMFDTGPGDIAGIILVGFVLMLPVKMLLRPHR